MVIMPDSKNLERQSATGSAGELVKVDGVLLEADYTTINEIVKIRLTIKGLDGKAYEAIDDEFRPYFYFVPSGEAALNSVKAMVSAGNASRITELVKEPRSIFGKQVNSYRVYVSNPTDVPKVAESLRNMGDTYEYDIPFSKRYLIDKEMTPLTDSVFTLKKAGNMLLFIGYEQKQGPPSDLNLNTMCFDIETYSPLGIPRPEKDPVIMLSYSYVSKGKKGNGVITFKKIDRDFVEYVKDEAELYERFAERVSELDIDIISGYNSANFDIWYLAERAKALKMDFNLGRFGNETRIERHGLVNKVKIGGRVHIDMYLVVKFIAVVGAAESILKLNSYTLKNVYDAISKDEKLTVEKTKGQKWKDINELWNGGAEDLGLLADYNLSDSESLRKVYETFVPITIELSRTTGNSLSDVAVSTTGQLVEFMLMRYAHEFKELIPNKPTEREIKSRLMNPIEGAYVKTPDPGIYENLAIFDFRGLYPSIIISHNIDPSALCSTCTDYYESPTGDKFDKNKKVIMPTILDLLVKQRAEVKKLYKKDKGSIFLGSRSQALKITSNSFYGYLGYARSRWYSRECASSVTAYGRQYIHNTIEQAESSGFRVIYGDTDSIVMLLGGKSKEEATSFVAEFNKKLPGSMELELEDFYRRGIFVGKKTEKGTITGAKKKYALITESGYIKIRGFELVRRDWSKVARDTQRKVLETILKEGSPEKAIQIVKDIIKELREGRVPLVDLAISTQLRKGIDSYDSKSPELAAAKDAVESGVKTKEEVEHAVISYVITRHGDSISDKAKLIERATDYDPDYYINHQVVPATMKILRELNYSEDEIKGLGKQKKLGE